MKPIFFLLILFFLLGGCVKLANSPQETNRDTTNDETEQTANAGSYNGFPSITTNASPSNPARGETFTLTVSSEDDAGIKTLSWESADTFSIQPKSNSFDCGLQKTCSVSWEFSSKDDGLKKIIVYATDSSEQESAKVPIEITMQPFDAPISTNPVCGDGKCESAESSSNCSSDCGSGSPVCGNKVCDEGEAFETCSGDCPYNGFACANNICEGGESYNSCPQDCGLSDIIGSACGDGACEPGEDADYCPADCTSIKPNCGNNICDSWETESGCRADCEGISGEEKNCNSNAECGYREACQGGKCVSVDCTNDAQCGYGKECENNRCVRCPSGPYGYAC